MDSLIQPASCQNESSQSLPRGGSDASGTGRADGSPIGTFRGAGGDGRPQFSASIDRNGYAWWYVDALSNDGRHGLTIIALIGSVFSPYYARARNKGLGDPLNHIAMNVALYGARGKRWAMTERGSGDLMRDSGLLRIGPSCMQWGEDGLTIDIDEVAVPFPKRIKGQIKLYPSAVQPIAYPLDQGGIHVWQPIAPVATVEVNLSSPDLSWRGHGYFDRNSGGAPLEDAFQSWHWSRANIEKSATIFYDVTPRQGRARGLALNINAQGHAEAIQPPKTAPLATTGWRIARATRSDAGTTPSIISTLEDTPFYARSVVSSRIGGRSACSMHESLDLDRFRMPVVQAMLPFRMPRRAS